MVRLAPCVTPPGVVDPCTEKYDCVCADWMPTIVNNADIVERVDAFPDEGETCYPDAFDSCDWVRKWSIGWHPAPAALTRRAAAFDGLAGYRFEICSGHDLFKSPALVTRETGAIVETATEDGVQFTREELFGGCTDCFSTTDRFLRVLAIGGDGTAFAICRMELPTDTGGSIGEDCPPGQHHDPETGECVPD